MLAASSSGETSSPADDCNRGPPDLQAGRPNSGRCLGMSGDVFCRPEAAAIGVENACRLLGAPLGQWIG